MSRILRVLAAALAVLALTAPVWAAGPDDAQQIRDQFKKVWADLAKGDPASAIAFCAPDPVYYGAWAGGPELWSVEQVGMDAFRKSIGSEVEEIKANLAKHPEWAWGAEVLHVDVKDDRAIVFNQSWTAKPDSTAREHITELSQEVVLLAKLNGEWKITNSITGINWVQKISKWGPQ
jgi:hypothetical protein